MKKRVLLIVAAALVIGSVGYYSMKKEQNYENFGVATTSASFEHHESVDELADEAELIVLGSFTGKRENFVAKDGKGDYISTISKSVVKIDKVIKGDKKKNSTIEVFEDCYLTDNQRYIATEGYKWMNEDGKYLLFLTPGTSDNTYVIVGIYEGKFDLTRKDRAKEHKDLKKAFLDPDVEFLGEDFELEHFYKLKGEALKKYNL
ncbi:hypothetical protein [Tumebacillus lipolyticus]|uniref:Bypass of forespore C C-terminal domain-containing protein n=1 Tax=Tumebacillus lipolyticus TaxID=1280370 RepID=A0ABW4ZTB7_9BACL